MANPIREISERELYKLAEQFDITVDDATAEDLQSQVNARLTAGIEDLYEYDIERERDAGTRTWSDGDDPHNAISTRCQVSRPENSGSLTDIEVGLKDNIAVAGIPMRCGSAALRGHIPQSDATVVERLLEAGATITAKTNMDAFAVGGRGVSFEGTIVNPSDESRSTGGSSGGSAAAVAAGYVDVALGTDTGGSVRMPAAFCGVVGFKPTYGLVSLSGIVENTYALDHVGPITETVPEAAAILDVLSGSDSDDPASVCAAGKDNYRQGGYLSAVETPPEPDEIRLATLSQQEDESIVDTVSNRHQQALASLRDAGCTIETIEFEDIGTIVQVKNAISYCELATHWRDGTMPYRRGEIHPGEDCLSLGSRLQSGGEELSDFHRSRMLAGAALIEKHGGRQYGRAHEVRRAITNELEEELDSFDAIVTPTVPHLAPKLDAEDDPDALSRKTDFGTGRYTKIANVTGGPAITVPNGSVDSAPIGLHLIGQQFDDAQLLAAAARIHDIIS